MATATYKLRDDSGQIDITLNMASGRSINDHIDTPSNVQVKQTFELVFYDANGFDAEEQRRLVQIALAQAKAALEAKRENHYVWLRITSDSTIHQRLVYSGTLKYSGAGSNPHQGDIYTATMELMVHPRLEKSAALSTVTGSGVSATGGTMTLGSAFTAITNYDAEEGSPVLADGRLKEVIVKWGTATFLTYLTEVWLGIHPKWSSQAFDPDVNISAGSRMDGGSGSTVTFASDGTDHQARIKYRLGDHVSTSLEAYKGRFRVLLRCKNNASASISSVQIGIGDYESEEYHGNDKIFFTDNNDAYKMIDLGVIEIPPWGMSEYEEFNETIVYSNFSDTGFFLLVGGDSGNTFTFDRLILMPADHMVHVQNAYIQHVLLTSGDDYNYSDLGLHVYAKPNEDVVGTSYRPASGPGVNNVFSPMANAIIDPQDWAAPHVDGTLVAVAQRDDQHNTSDTLDITLDIVPRYFSL